MGDRGAESRKRISGPLGWRKSPRSAPSRPDLAKWTYPELGRTLGSRHRGGPSWARPVRMGARTREGHEPERPKETPRAVSGESNASTNPSPLTRASLVGSSGDLYESLLPQENHAIEPALDPHKTASRCMAACSARSTP